MPDPAVRGLDSLALGESGVPILLRKRVIAALAAAFCALVVAYFAAAQLLGISLTFDAEPFRGWVDRFGILGPIVFIVVMALSVLFAPIPNVPIFIAAGLAWGPVVGTAYSMAGLTLGSAMAFYAARYLGRRHLRRLVGQHHADRLDHLATTMGGRVIFWSRVLPAVNFDWISFVAGMTAMPFHVFIIYSFFGMLGPTALTVTAGDSLSHNPAIAIAIAGVWMAAILLSAAFFWRRRRRWGRASSADARTSADPGPEFGNPG
jgi:uncharacterized membrane protein YdjX (TVP38/TMEM64 family)